MRRFGRGENVHGVYSAPIQDSADAYVPKANRFVTSVANIASAITVNKNVGYYNGGAKVTRTTEAETVLTVEGRDFPPLLMAMFLGKVYNEATGMIYDDGSQSDAPYCATSFHRVYESGVKFEQYLKGKWSIDGEESATSGEDIDPKNITMVFTAITTEYQWDLSESGGAVYDFDNDAFTALAGGSKRYQKVISKSVTKDEYLADKDSWYANVQVPAATTLPELTLSSSVPADAATDIAVNSSVQLTLSNSLSNVVFVMLDSSNASVAGAVSWSDNAKSFTFTPTENLANGAEYTAVYSCIDVYGQKLQGAVKFTTIAE